MIQSLPCSYFFSEKKTHQDSSHLKTFHFLNNFARTLPGKWFGKSLNFETLQIRTFFFLLPEQKKKSAEKRAILQAVEL